MSSKLAQECRNKSHEIANYLSSYLIANKSFKLRSFYGESFTLNLLFRNGILSEEIKKILIDEYLKKDKDDPEFHFEFNNYAFSDYLQLSKDKTIKDIFMPLRFKGTACTNWTFLRSKVRIYENVDAAIGLSEVHKKIAQFQDENGLILDDPGVKSFQYHCFSSAMLCEIYELKQDPLIYNAFLKSVKFIRHFILENGEALYIGRGQEQSFGLGVLIYILAKYAKYTRDESALDDIRKILKFINKFQYQNGAFPLVFTGLESAVPENVNMEAEAFCGWYPYNNFFDYLPFLGFFLHKASVIIDKLNLENITPKPAVNYFDKSFMKIIKPSYTAILSIPGGYWTNDLPMPLIYAKNKFLTPMLGGEQFQKSLYALNSLSMPMTKNGMSWRRYGRGFFFGKSLVWISLFGILKRSYDFQEHEIIVAHSSFSWVPSVQSFSFLKCLKPINDNNWESDSLRVSFNSKIINIEKGYSAMGELKILQSALNTRVKMEIK